MSEYVDVTICPGKLRGIIEKDWKGCKKFIAFRGIPYAKPPIGELRFKDPEPAEPWSSIRKATKYGNIALQMNYTTKQTMGNEDCLYLNVYTTDIHTKKKRPVMVWIHGGGFFWGSGCHFYYGPDYIVRKQVVLVTINYRLGALGFLNLDDESAAGNQGLKDAVMALRWVHDNISKFGGDPENVTIFGQGSGGAMVHYLAVCPQADGLLHKAISQSGTAANTWACSEKETQKARSFRLVKKLGRNIADPKDAVRFLRSIDAVDIVKASIDILMKNEGQKFVFPFTPSVDCDSPNSFFVEHPAIMLRRGVKVPFIIGFNSSEGSLLARGIDDDSHLEYVNSDLASVIHPTIWPILKRKSLTVKDVRFSYFGNELVSMKTIANFMSLLGDMHFHFGILLTIRIQMLIGHRSTYLYTFSYEPKYSEFKKRLNITYPGAVHGEELNYLFCSQACQCIRCQVIFSVKCNPEKWMIIERMTQMWTDFAKTGDPTPAITPLIPIEWRPQLRTDEFQFLTIDKHLRLETIQKKKLRFFEAL